MKSLLSAALFLIALGGLSSPASPDCENREAHESSQTTYDPVFMCDGVPCGPSSHRIIEYTCPEDPAAMCVERELMLKEKHILFECVNDECKSHPRLVLDNGFITMLCP